MIKIVSPENWIPNANIKLEDNADIAVRCKENILVEAGPGAGKTELLAQKACYLLQTNLCNNPQKILAISFKKDAAKNLAERVEKRCGKEYSDRFSSMTYDAFSKKILDHFRFALPIYLIPDSNYEVNDNGIIDAAFKKAGYNNPLRLNRNMLFKFYEKKIISTTIPFQQDDLGGEVWKLLLNGFDDYPACLTYKMISILANYIIKTNPYICRALKSTYSYVFLDEFQDTTDLQYNLVKTCFESSNSYITAVGDTKQRIMIWAGARESVFNDFQADFKASRINLLMNHRSVPRLVKLQEQMYSSLEEKNVNILTSDKWNADDGDIRLFMSDTEESEADLISKDILEKVSLGIELNDICILCKQTPQNYTEKIIEKLSDNGVRARSENEYQDLIKEPVVELLNNMILLANERRRPNEWENINEFMFELWNMDIDSNNEIYYSAQEKVIQMLDLIAAHSKKITDFLSLKQIIAKIISFFGKQSLQEMFEVYSQEAYLDKCIDCYAEYLWKEYVLCNDAVSAVENFQGLNSIPIMTIHKSKGLEYTAVYFVGLEDGAFWSFKNQPKEDRCAFFVALSRAKQYIRFSFCEIREKLRNKNQKHEDINEFFELLQAPGIAEIVSNEIKEDK